MKCDIIAATHAEAFELKRIAGHCALDLGHGLECETRASPDPGETEAHLVLRLDIGEAVASSAGYCLACRLACFCPKARVSLLISAARCFGGVGGETRDHAPGAPRRAAR